MVAGFLEATGANDWQTIANDAATQGKGVWQTGYQTRSAALAVPAGVHWEAITDSAWNGGSAGPAITFGASGVPNFGADITIGVDRDPNDWTGAADDVGVRIYNPQCCRIRIMYLRGFTIGLEIIAESGLEAYGNIIEVSSLLSSREQLVMRASGSGSKIRDNLVIGGRTSVFSNMDAETGHRSSWWLKQGASTEVKNNLWLKPSVESRRGSDPATNNLSYMRCQDGASENEMTQVRDESLIDTSSSGDGFLVADGAATEYNLCRMGFFDFNRDSLAGVLVNGAPSNVNAVSRNKEETEGTSSLEDIGYTTY